MKEKINKVKTAAGLDIYFLTDPRFTTSTVQMCFRLGWRYDDQKYLGLAHLFEHLVGKRTKKYPAKSEFDKVKDENGIVSNAFTSPDSTVYYQSQSHTETLKSVELLFEAIYQTHFLEEDLEKEKEVVLTEAREYLDEDDSLLWHETQKTLFPGSTMSKFFFGDVDTMKNIDLKVFEDFYSIYKNPKNSFLVIGTNEAKIQKKVVAFVNKFFKENQVLTKTKLKTWKEVIQKPANYHLIEKPDRAQANLRFNWVGHRLTFKERMTFAVTRRLLTSSFASRIIKRLRDVEGFIYWIGLSRYTFLGGHTFINFQTKTKRENLEKLEEALFEELNKASKEISDTDVKKTIPIIEYWESKDIEVESMVGNLISSVLFKEKYIDSKTYLNAIKKVKAKDVRKLIAILFDRSKMIKTLIK